MTWSLIAWNCLYALLILVGGLVLSAWLRDAAALALERTRLDILVRKLLVSLVRPVVLSIAVFAALSQVGIPMTTFAAMAGAATLAIGMAVRGSLSNIASGGLLLSLRPFEKGDVITAGGHTGAVTALGLFHTTLHVADGNTVTLPNDTVWSGAIVNRSDRPTRRIDLTFVLVQDADIPRADALIREVFAADERVLDDPAPRIVYNMDQLGISLQALAHVANPQFGVTQSDCCQAILAAFREHGILLATRAR